MFFNNIHFYRFEEPFNTTGLQLNEALQQRKARNCGAMELACEGWSEPLGLEGQALVHQTNGKFMICLRREDKILPASLVREKIVENVFQIEQEQGRPVGRKEKMDIKDTVIQELLPRAFAKTSHTYAYIDPENAWLIVNASGSKKAEELIALLRKTLGTLNVVLPQTTMSPEAMMTRWLTTQEPIAGGLEIEDEVELRSSGEVESVIRCKHVDLSSQEIQAHISTGKRVHRLALNWQDRISFMLHDDFSMHRLRYNFELIEDYDANGDGIAQFDADFAIMSAELAEFIASLLNALNPSPEELPASS
ncbi:MAG: recombination-associated protein RdgC [Zetaproteobacteria bacterium CG_4_9_14_3_um_filter_49_83]|nr:MAG: recombination-associated protein RdgC [Zetaproteobacteria bacterium CG1_02_49_23]PIQ32801.1 MAG: recombination-associated protein RdgC [Zetaproteobacteria bacterium CG17_big_fil_post_rev_8_21_14_2_50_50_13]PIV29869.1 MAG: recombination-associated protein RdgC [Zetaproteobacteria bacterium CG02_land_8_20_14_3_00_50_9]PIY56678.1 MAG: recombination-associated protein RdgC [Zetaproteobacteria bacterium CG_4_10_14_0_8_um_filter_49_80]PJA33766.1 MAG: recombination-associated protein RdgC [Zet